MSGRLRLYRREGEPGMCCVVEGDEPLPVFIETGRWLLDAAPLDPDAPPTGFDRRAAADALRSMGCYMFHGLAPDSAARPRRSAPDG
jgi:hypothetical protein